MSRKPELQTEGVELQDVLDREDPENTIFSCIMGNVGSNVLGAWPISLPLLLQLWQIF